jgi:hypothetical protein
MKYVIVSVEIKTNVISKLKIFTLIIRVMSMAKFCGLIMTTMIYDEKGKMHQTKIMLLVIVMRNTYY